MKKIAVVVAIPIALVSCGEDHQRNPEAAAAPVTQSAPAPAPLPLALSLHADGLVVTNQTAAPLDQCTVEILGGFIGRIPILPAQSAEARSFVQLFDSADHEYEAHAAGQTFEAYVYQNASTKTVVSCRDLNGRRVAQTFH